MVRKTYQEASVMSPFIGRKFKVELLDVLLVEYPMHHKVSGHHCGDNTVKRIVLCCFGRKIFATDSQQDCLQQA
jgi:hypothetical protein